MSEEAVKFVQLIESYPCIYNNTMQEYSRKDLTDKAWAAIAQQMKWSAADCKKWKNMRNGFVRSLKPSPSGSSAKVKKPYYLHDIMGFVLPYVKPVHHLENTGNFILPDSDIHHHEEVESSEYLDLNCDVMPHSSKRMQDTPSSVEKTKKKKKCPEEKDEVDAAVLNYLKEKNERKTVDDSPKMFLQSSLPDVMSLSNARLRTFKVRTLLFLEELISEQEQEAANRFVLPSCSIVTVGTPASSPLDPQTPTTVIYTTDSNSENDREGFSCGQQFFFQKE